MPMGVDLLSESPDDVLGLDVFERLPRTRGEHLVGEVSDVGMRSVGTAQRDSVHAVHQFHEYRRRELSSSKSKRSATNLVNAMMSSTLTSSCTGPVGVDRVRFMIGSIGPSSAWGPMTISSATSDSRVAALLARKGTRTRQVLAV